MADKKNFLLAVTLLVAIGLSLTLSSAEASPSSAGGDCSTSTANDGCNIVQGFRGNSAAPDVVGATIGGGGSAAFRNSVERNFGTVAGGLDNAAGDRASVGGGAQNRANGVRATIAGGFSNSAPGENAAIGGGYGNTASDIDATVAGGFGNTAGAWDSTIGGGAGNVANFHLATVAGGSFNKATSLNSFVGGGDTNIAEGTYSAVSGGSENTAHGFIAAVDGGTGNKATGVLTFVGGGLGNLATGQNSIVAGGWGNVAGTQQDDQVSNSTVGGGLQNTASGNSSTVPGGTMNRAGGDYSLAAGRRAIIDPSHPGSFLFADSSDADFTSAAPNEFAVRATGGVRLVTAIDSNGNPTGGVRLPKGGGSWEALSDSAAKTNISPVNGESVLSKLAKLPISTWSYRSEDPSIVHIGPMAQDFRVFGTAADSGYINMMDENGVALAAIQELTREDQAKDARLAEQEQKISSLEGQVSSLDARLAALESRTGSNAAPTSSQDHSAWLLVAGLAVGGLGYFRRGRER